jgi:hypothetical protein
MWSKTRVASLFGVRSNLALRGVVIQRKVAASYWISRQTVSDIWRGRSWRLTNPAKVQ